MRVVIIHIKLYFISFINHTIVDNFTTVPADYISSLVIEHNIASFAAETRRDIQKIYTHLTSELMRK